MNEQFISILKLNIAKIINNCITLKANKFKNKKFNFIISVLSKLLNICNFIFLKNYKSSRKIQHELFFWSSIIA